MIDIEKLFAANLTTPVGYGRDEFSIDKDYHYPEAIAAYGRAAHSLGHRDIVDDCINALKDREDCWGLPWDWNLFSDPDKMVPANSGFVSTTSDVLNFQLDVGHWPNVEWLKEHAFIYGEHPNAHQHIYNAQAQALIVLRRIGEFHLANLLTSNLIDKMWNGLWPYSKNRPFSFEAHQCMVIEGMQYTLWDCNYSLHQYWNNFFEKGWGYSSATKIGKPMSPRFMALSALVFEKANMCERAEMILENLDFLYIDPESYKINDTSGAFYVRQAAQVLSALTRMDCFA